MLGGASLGVFLGVTVVLMGVVGFITGQSHAECWRPIWKLGLYIMLLGLADRFLASMLFGANTFSVAGYVLDTAVIGLIAISGYRVTRVQKMVTQYPWLYERANLFEWRERK